MSGVDRLPEPVRNVLDDFVAQCSAAFGSSLRAVVLFGSAAEARLRPTSDVNVIVVLSAFDAAAADTIRDVLRSAHAAIRLEVMFLLVGEIARAAEAFAVKFADIAERHVVLHGDDPFGGLRVSGEALRYRTRQVLLNQVLRLRERYAMAAGRDEVAVRLVADAAAPLRSAAAAILRLEGRPAESPKAALATLVAEVEGRDWSDVLGAVSRARETGRLGPGEAKRVLAALMELAAALLDRTA